MTTPHHGNDAQSAGARPPPPDVRFVHAPSIQTKPVLGVAKLPLLIYARVSSIEQVLGETIDAQIRQGVAYAEEHGFAYVVYQPAKNESGSRDAMEHRPSLQRLLDDVEEKKVALSG